MSNGYQTFYKFEKFKKCGGFFFLFFLHGTSIGTRQQGISYNVLQLCEGRAFNH
jgi:hypothetical protein